MMVVRIYADAGATSFPKAPGMVEAMKSYLDEGAFNINRGGYGASYETALKVQEVREKVSDFFGAKNPRYTVFTPGITYSLNSLYMGLLKPGDHVITTSVEHNCVMRPLHFLAKKGVELSIANCGNDGSLDVGVVKSLIKPNTKIITMIHATNVCGRILPLDDIAQLCKETKVKLIVDTAQTAGYSDIKAVGIDALAFTAHKGLLAAPGLGGLILSPETADELEPVIFGGTGSFSDEYSHPTIMPDKLESGTLNLPGIIGLGEAIGYIGSVGLTNMRKHKQNLTEAFIQGISGVKNINIYGGGGVPVISIDFINADNAEIAARLDEDYSIMTRCGLHCAPSAHKTLGTYPNGTVRFSFGYFNTLDEINEIVRAVKEVA